MNPKVWNNKIDNRYDVFVERLAPLQGELVVMLLATEIAREPVSIAFDARFGVDSLDEATWVAKCCQIVDAHRRNEIV